MSHFYLDKIYFNLSNLYLDVFNFYTIYLYLDNFQFLMFHLYLDKTKLSKHNDVHRALRALDARIAGSSESSSGLAVSHARLAYLDACDGCTTATRAFQTQLFVNIAGNVFGVTFSTLTAFNALMSDGADAIRIAAYYLYDSLVRTLQMYFVIDACHTTVEQVGWPTIE